MRGPGEKWNLQQLKGVLKDDVDDNDYDDIPLSIIARSKELFGLPLLEVADCDKHVKTCDEIVVDWFF